MKKASYSKTFLSEGVFSVFCLDKIEKKMEFNINRSIILKQFLYTNNLRCVKKKCYSNNFNEKSNFCWKPLKIHTLIIGSEEILFLVYIFISYD